MLATATATRSQSFLVGDLRLEIDAIVFEKFSEDAIAGSQFWGNGGFDHCSVFFSVP